MENRASGRECEAPHHPIFIFGDVAAVADSRQSRALDLGAPGRLLVGRHQASSRLSKAAQMASRRITAKVCASLIVKAEVPTGSSMRAVRGAAAEL